MKVRKEELKLKKDLSEIEVGDMLCVDERDYLSVVRTASRSNQEFNYCAMLISSPTIQFWFTSETMEDLRKKVRDYPIKIERFSKDEYDLTIMCKVGVGELKWDGC